MQQVVPDIAIEVVTVVAMAVGSVVLTGIGLLGEQAGLSNVLGGSLALGSWELFIGTWAVFVGVYLLAYKQVLPRVGQLVSG